MFKFANHPLNFILAYVVLVAVSEANFIKIDNFTEDLLLTALLLIPIVLYLVLYCKARLNILIKRVLGWPSYIIVLYLLWALLTIGFSIDQEKSLSYIAGSLIVFTAGFVVVYHTFDRNWFKRLLYTFSGVGILASLYALFALGIQYFNPDFISTFALINVGFSDWFVLHNIPFLISYFNHPNVFGILIFYSFAACLSLLFIEKDRKIQGYIQIFAVFLFIILILSFSRTSWVSSAFFLGLLTLPSIRKKLWIVPTMFVVLSLLGMYVTSGVVTLETEPEGSKPFSNNQVQLTNEVNAAEGEKIKLLETEELSETESSEDIDVKPTGRLKQGLSRRDVLWKTSVEYIKSNPVFGAGFGNSPEAIAPLFPDLHSFLKGLSPHNTYLRIAVESGIVGLFLYLFLILSFFKLFFQKLKRVTVYEWALLFFITSILLLQVFETTFLLGTGFRSFYFLILLAGGFKLLKDI